MLVGMAFFKWGIFNAARSPRMYRTLVAVGLGVGIPLIVYGVQRNFAADWDARYALFFGSEYKVLRGGSWATRPGAVRNSFRNWDYPIRRQIFSGFRCARDV